MDLLEKIADELDAADRMSRHESRAEPINLGMIAAAIRRAVAAEKKACRFPMHPPNEGPT